ncbi:MAG TPA: helix-hairpin-helix domain-containing protein, partial [Solirubrobacteraceae bacterium]|nr:helix-hairpin-helix domain-containing protein [Solirubrobacteraceae bacterium]
FAAIAGAETARFQAVPGIGKRTAERIIVELREKVGVGAQPDGLGVVGRLSGPRALAYEGLVALGYSSPEAEGLLRDLDGGSAEELIAAALRTARAA